MNFLGLGPGELLLIMVLALIVFGPGKLPEIGQGLGRAVREFRKATDSITQEFNRELSLDSLTQPPAAQAAPAPAAQAAPAPATPVAEEPRPSTAPAVPETPAVPGPMVVEPALSEPAVGTAEGNGGESPTPALKRVRRVKATTAKTGGDPSPTGASVKRIRSLRAATRNGGTA